LSLDDVKNYVVLLPPPHEQSALVAWIENQARNLDAGIAAIRREVALVREVWARLAADVVTGKVDVSEAVRAFEAKTQDPALGTEIDELDDNEDSIDSGVEEAAEEAEA